MTSKLLPVALPVILKTQISKKENYILMTNVKNPISIEGVAVGTLENSNKKVYFLMYKVYSISERAEISEETYNFVESLFDLILNKEDDLEDHINNIDF